MAEKIKTIEEFAKEHPEYRGVDLSVAYAAEIIKNPKVRAAIASKIDKVYDEKEREIGEALDSIEYEKNRLKEVDGKLREKEKEIIARREELLKVIGLYKDKAVEAENIGKSALAKKEEFEAKAAEAEQKKAEYDGKKAELDAYKCSLDAKEAELNAKETAVAKKGEELDSIAAALKEETKKLEDEKTVYEAVKFQIEAEDEELAEKKKELADAQKALEKRERAFRFYETDLKRREDSIKAKEGKLEALDKELYNRAERLEKEAAAREKALEELRAELSAREKKMKELEALAASAKKEQEEIKKRAEKMVDYGERLKAKEKAIQEREAALAAKEAELWSGQKLDKIWMLEVAEKLQKKEEELKAMEQAYNAKEAQLKKDYDSKLSALKELEEDLAAKEQRLTQDKKIADEIIRGLNAAPATAAKETAYEQKLKQIEAEEPKPAPKKVAKRPIEGYRLGSLGLSDARMFKAIVERKYELTEDIDYRFSGDSVIPITQKGKEALEKRKDEYAGRRLEEQAKRDEGRQMKQPLVQDAGLIEVADQGEYERMVSKYGLEDGRDVRPEYNGGSILGKKRIKKRIKSVVAMTPKVAEAMNSIVKERGHEFVERSNHQIAKIAEKMGEINARKAEMEERRRRRQNGQ